MLFKFFDKKKLEKVNKVKLVGLVLALLYCAFLSLFALDIFSEGYGVVELLVGLVMHLMPNFVLLALIFLAWKKTLVGGITFLLLGVGFTFMFDTYQHVISFLVISGPLFLIGGILTWSGWQERELKK